MGSIYSPYRRNPQFRERSEQLKHQVETRRPPYCECARVGVRPLFGANDFLHSPAMGNRSLLDRANLEVLHEHIFFEASGDNIGFEKQGLFEEALGVRGYRLDTECYDGHIMREAIRRVKPATSYHLLLRNCQHYVEKVLQVYRGLLNNIFPSDLIR